MKTLYVDVYFLLNFSVDLLAIYFALSLVHIPTRFWRVLLCGGIGAGFAVISVFLSDLKTLVFALSFVCVFLMSILIVKRCSTLLRIRFCVFFLSFLILLSGAVSWLFQTIRNNINITNNQLNNMAENRMLISVGAVILLGIGILQLLKAGLCHSFSTLSVSVRFDLFGKRFETMALVDSGNLLKDPMSGIPIMLTHNKMLLPQIKEEDLYDYPLQVRKKVRMIPFCNRAKTNILYAWQPEKVTVVKGKKEQEIKILIAYDKEGENYGGYESLLPYAAIDHVP